MDIQRIDDYTDRRFSKTVLNQHGAYLVDNEPYQVEITDAASAVLYGNDPAVFQTLIEKFRFHAPHIFKFYDPCGRRIAEYPAPVLLDVPLDSMQPPQFYVRAEKLKAVQTFIGKPEDVVVQVIPYGDRFVSLDGHTRLYGAVQKGFTTVKAVESETDDFIWTFVREAQRRKIRCPRNLVLLPHDTYKTLWDGYCDEVFAGTES